MISTCELIQKLQACTCLEDVSNLREELYEDLEPEQHALVFSRTAYFLSLPDFEDGIPDEHLLEVRVDVENQPEPQPHIPPITKLQHGCSNEEVAPDFDDDGIPDEHLLEMLWENHEEQRQHGYQNYAAVEVRPSRCQSPTAVAGPSRGQPSVAAVAGPSRDQPSAAVVAGPSRGQPPAAAVAGPSSSSSVHVGGSSTVASKKRAADAIPARDAPLPTHHITKVSQKHVRKYNANVTDYTVSFQPIENSVPIINMMPRVNEMFENIIEEMVQGVNDRDFVRLVFNTPQLDRPVSMPFVRRDQLNHEAFATKLENTIQSNEEVTLDENVSFNIIHMAMPNGRGSSVRCLSIDDMLFRKRCIIRMKNADNMCCPRAIVTGIARIEKHPNWNSIRQGYKEQREYAIDLYKQAGIPVNTRCGIEEIKLFENTPRMANYRVVLVSREHLNFVTYTGPEDRQHTIYLYIHDNHFDLITSMSAFYNKSYFCEKCLKGYDGRLEHKCIHTCKLCRGKNCPVTNESDSYERCTDCDPTFGVEELKKGFFPHFFNTTANAKYRGPMPDAKYYHPSGMSSKKREEFLQWYEKEVALGRQFVMEEEIHAYCVSDVDILRRCCLKFRNLFREITRAFPGDRGVDPFSNCITIAAACHLVFRRNFLREKTIGIIPPLGYTPQRHSV
ncbi:uncharacterized protein [Diadema setosum]|uniref:uncharacterized protein n=1 Tax=Diadema setosum TaxID=31175 RepID=UPI003B3A7107